MTISRLHLKLIQNQFYPKCHKCPLTFIRKFSQIQDGGISGNTIAVQVWKRKGEAILPSQIENSLTSRETFIPLTRSSVVRHIISTGNFFENNAQQLEKFALSLHGVVISHDRLLLQELKVLFAPLNPDKDTMLDKQMTTIERLDQEFWLLQKLSIALKKGNFHELPMEVISTMKTNFRKVSINIEESKYGVLRIWTLGQEIPPFNITWSDYLLSKIKKHQLPQPLEKYKNRINLQEPLKYYRRVVLAVRMKKDSKLTLKAFKDIPIDSLVQLLPNGRIEMTKTDKTILKSCLSVMALGIFSKLITLLAGFYMNWMLWVSVATALVASRIFINFKNSKALFLSNLHKVIYSKNISSNYSLLGMIVSRAEDELFKEAFLTYSFLLAENPPTGKTEKLQDKKLDTVEQAKTHSVSLQEDELQKANEPQKAKND